MIVESVATLQAPPRKGSDTYDYLVLAENRLKELPDDSLAVFPNVQILNLSNNFIVEVSDDVIKREGGVARWGHLDHAKVSSLAA